MESKAFICRARVTDKTMPSALGLSTYRWNNNIKSALLLLAFPFLLLGLLGGFFALAGYLYIQPDGAVHPTILQSFGLSGFGLTPWQMATAGVWEYWPIVTGFAAVWVLFGYLFNDAMIHAATGARAVERRDAPKLYNLLENLCIARGLKTPRLYIIDGDEMNAYASGMDEHSYSITVTRGLLEHLDDIEVEAVLGHELTHILNRDVRLLVVTIVFTGMISFIAQTLWRSLRFAAYGRNRDREGGGGAFALMLLASVLLAFGYVLALVLRFAISRKRE